MSAKTLCEVGTEREKSDSEFRNTTPRPSHGLRSSTAQITRGRPSTIVLDKEKQYFGLTRGKKSVCEAAEYLNTPVDDSVPDTDLSQIEHLLRTL